jgi:diaminopimelate decarboxylase
MAIEKGGALSPEKVVSAADRFGTPLYLYDEAAIVDKCRLVLGMPNAFGLGVRFAMKANSSRALLQLVASQGIGIDASSLNEARRAHLAGIPHDRMMLTTQDVPEGDARRDLEAMIDQGLVYNACSLRQLELIGDFAGARHLPLSVRVNPGAGAGESVTRNTGDNYSSFGIHQTDLERAVGFGREKGLRIAQVHVHIGSGGAPALWRRNIDRMLEIVEQHFPDAETLNLGGGFKEARMPDEKAANIRALGAYAKRRFRDFAARTGRKLAMAVEPGTYLVANAGYLVTRVIDRKHSGPSGFDFVVIDGGMEANTRPLLYGSRHPFYVVSRSGDLLSSEMDSGAAKDGMDLRAVVGRCCESGDSQSLDQKGHIVPRTMADPRIGDYIVIGGAGAYCSSMSLHNYNSQTQAPEVLVRTDGSLRVIRKPQSIDQMLTNETALEN